MSQRSGSKVPPTLAWNYFNSYLENGGSNNMAVDGSVTTVTFAAFPPAGKDLEVGRFLIYMESGSDFDGAKFMHLDALDNGVQIKIAGTVVTTWRNNIDVRLDMFDLLPGFGKETRSLVGRWTLTKGLSGGSVLCPAGQSVDADINDDLSAAGIIYRIKVQGELRDV